MNKQKLANIKNRLNDQIPFGAKYIMEALKQSGFQSYIVGGCVRDAVINELYPELNAKVDDWDITTNALPEDIKRIFAAHTLVLDGEKSGTIKVYIEDDKDIYDVTTFRGDGEYSDGRHPDSVIFNVSLEEDLSRRDATMNAIAFNNEFIDPFNGLEDIEHKIIRAVGDANTRVKEDGLRSLRYIRFAAQKGFKIEENTLNAIKENANLIQKISRERIQKELNKMIYGKYIGYMKLLFSTGILHYIIPELEDCFNCSQNKYHFTNVGDHSLLTAFYAPEKLKLAALFHDIGKPITKTDENGKIHFIGHAEKSAEMVLNILKRLKYDNKTIKYVHTISKYHDSFININKDTKQIKIRKQIKKLLYELDSPELVKDILEFKIADTEAQNKLYQENKIELFNSMILELEDILQSNEPWKKKHLNITSHEIMEYGIKGPDMSKVFNHLILNVIGQPSLNTNQKLRNLVIQFSKTI